MTTDGNENSNKQMARYKKNTDLIFPIAFIDVSMWFHTSVYISRKVSRATLRETSTREDKSHFSAYIFVFV